MPDPRKSRNRRVSNCGNCKIMNNFFGFLMENVSGHLTSSGIEAGLLAVMEHQRLLGCFNADPFGL